MKFYSVTSIRAFVCLFFLGFFFNVQSQVLQVSVNVTPPYSVHLQDYLSSGDNILFTVTNTSGRVLNYKLIATMTGDNGVSATINPDYQPSSPITIQAFETQVLSLNQLRQYNSNLTENDIDVVGYPKSLLIQTEALPEGEVGAEVSILRAV